MPAKNASRRQNLERLNAASEARDQGEILAAVLSECKRVGIMDAAKRAGMTRGSLYSALGEGSNPTLAMMLKIWEALGFVCIVQGTLPGDKTWDKA